MSQSPTPPPPPGPLLASFAGFGEEAVRDLCGILGPLFAVLTDEVGNPATVLVHAAYADEAGKYPQVVPRVKLGPQPINPGNNIAWADRTIGGSAYYGELATDSQIIFDIYALSDPQRQYLMAYLRYGIQTAYTIDATSGQPIGAYVLKQMDDAGIIPKRFMADLAPDPRTTDARPYGQVYRATVAMQADVACSWVVPLTPYPPLTVQVTATPDVPDPFANTVLYVPATLPPFPSITDPPIVVP